MVNMQLTKAEAAKDYGTCAPGAPADDTLPRYPYGLELLLDNESLAKLGLTTLPDVGYVLSLAARVTVTDVSESQSQGNEPRKSMRLQITEMELGTPGRSDADIAATLWPS